ncbi:Sphingolipid delta(4)-desaturase DES1 [Seminavis robusta]|uniref:Sphingolipid delta(4)-desaturase DES1 n=1 Tax=Seminavis robusta TaxID=568900 RepID=A0A9N8DQQ2_9STRA|nr:Sphingolipid delta(4)-desaturase DES1 [Seminavis robusta]|eukprot:Sro271_g104540.1 Sphingolipid delta(4)-desaturase DES1 (326) ;mRNA; f:34271-35248
MSTPTKATRFTPKDPKIIHAQRQRLILAKYPQIRELYGPDIRLFYSMVAITAAQFTLAYFASKIESNWSFVFVAWSLGGLLTHWLSLGNHELGHNLAFKTPIFNEALGMFANLAQAIPSMMSFKKYHAPHHYHLNDAEKDPDAPTTWEAGFFNTPWRKAAWMMCQSLFYALRPLITMPKPPSAKEIFNVVFVLSFDALLVYSGPTGFRMALFNFISTLLGMGIHPIAGHFISEHYDLYNDDSGQETYSYYGPLNYFAFNVGYHNEHHDFPKISGFNLPKVTAIAPEFYMNLNPHYSWSKIVYDYIMGSDTGPYKRIIRRERPKAQ